MLGKILFITSRYGGLPEGLINALRRMQTDYKEVPIWAMTETFREFQPNTMIFFHHNFAEWNSDIANEVNTLHCHKILWDWECPWQIDELVPYHGLFGYILVQDKSSKLALDNRINNKVVFVPHAADYASCAPLIDIPFQYRSDLCFIGAAYPSRMRFLRAVLPHLQDYKVILGGGGYEYLPNTKNQLILQRSTAGSEYLLYTQGAKIVLNLHRESLELTMNNNEKVLASSPNNRFFEVYAMKKFQMVDDIRMPELLEYYPNPVTFSNPEDFLAKFMQWIKDASGRKQHEERNYEHTLTYHSYENRFAEIISKLI